MIRRILCLFGVIAGLALVGCGSAAAGSNSPAGAVEAYYQAVTGQNADQLVGVVCPEFQEQARTELDSFQGVKSTLEGFACKETGKEGDYTLVKCTGKIVAMYGSEKMDIPLVDRLHKVKSEGGAFKVCGY